MNLFIKLKIFGGSRIYVFLISRNLESQHSDIFSIDLIMWWRLICFSHSTSKTVYRSQIWRSQWPVNVCHQKSREFFVAEAEKLNLLHTFSGRHIEPKYRFPSNFSLAIIRKTNANKTSVHKVIPLMTKVTSRSTRSSLWPLFEQYCQTVSLGHGISSQFRARKKTY